MSGNNDFSPSAAEHENKAKDQEKVQSIYPGDRDVQENDDTFDHHHDALFLDGNVKMPSGSFRQQAYTATLEAERGAGAPQVRPVTLEYGNEKHIGAMANGVFHGTNITLDVRPNGDGGFSARPMNNGKPDMTIPVQEAKVTFVSPFEASPMMPPKQAPRAENSANALANVQDFYNTFKNAPAEQQKQLAAAYVKATPEQQARVRENLQSSADKDPQNFLTVVNALKQNLQTVDTNQAKPPESAALANAKPPESAALANAKPPESAALANAKPPESAALANAKPPESAALANAKPPESAALANAKPPESAALANAKPPESAALASANPAKSPELLSGIHDFYNAYKNASPEQQKQLAAAYATASPEQQAKIRDNLQISAQNDREHAVSVINSLQENIRAVARIDRSNLAEAQQKNFSPPGEGRLPLGQSEQHTLKHEPGESGRGLTDATTGAHTTESGKIETSSLSSLTEIRALDLNLAGNAPGTDLRVIQLDLTSQDARVQQIALSHLDETSAGSAHTDAHGTYEAIVAKHDEQPHAPEPSDEAKADSKHEAELDAETDKAEPKEEAHESAQEEELEHASQAEAAVRSDAIIAMMAAKKLKEEAEAEEEAEKAKEKEREIRNSLINKGKNDEDTKRRRYIVKEKETLQSIALRQLRDVRLAPLLFRINRAVIPVTVQRGKEVVNLRVGLSIWLPSALDIREFRTQLATTAPPARSSSAESPGGGGQTFASAEEELATAFGANWDGTADTTTQSPASAENSLIGEAIEASKARRQNIESMLGPVGPKQTDPSERIHYVVRLGDSLKSVAMKHPLLQDVGIWRLVAEVNSLPTETDARGTPLAILSRGMILNVPTVAEIAQFKARESEGRASDDEMEKISCHACGCSNPAFATACSACQSELTDKGQADSTRATADETEPDAATILLKAAGFFMAAGETDTADDDDDDDDFNDDDNDD